jgi:hypothetical protein
MWPAAPFRAKVRRRRRLPQSPDIGPVTLPSPVRFTLWSLWILGSVAVAAYGWMLLASSAHRPSTGRALRTPPSKRSRQLETGFRDRWWLARLFPRGPRPRRRQLPAAPLRAGRLRQGHRGGGGAAPRRHGSGGGRAVLARERLLPEGRRDRRAGRAGGSGGLAAAGGRGSTRRRSGRSSLDWDLKYNHELVADAARADEHEGERWRRFFDLLRPQDKNGPQPPQPTGGRMG